MTPDKVNKLNGIGVVLRFVHPALFAIISTLIIFILTGIKTDVLEVKGGIKEVGKHFTNHLSDHKQIEIALEKRLTYLETLIRKIK